MQVGDLVLVKPAGGVPCIVVNLQASNAGGLLENCVTLYVPHHNARLPMNKKWLEVISACE